MVWRGLTGFWLHRVLEPPPDGTEEESSTFSRISGSVAVEAVVSRMLRSDFRYLFPNVQLSPELEP